MSEPQPERDEAPTALVAALRALESDALPPARVDAAVLAAARARFVAPVVRPRRWLHPAARIGLPLAAAAALVVYVGIVALPPRPPEPAFAAHDFNRDGRVDIVDALVLRSRLRSGHVVGDARSLDLNGDGRADDADVLALAAQVVRVTAPSGRAT